MNPAMSSASAAIRYSLFYAAFFAVLGVYGPFWPVWLSARGLDSERIGFVIALSLVVKTIATPIVSQVAERFGGGKRPMIFLILASVGSFSLYYFAHSFVTILCVASLYATAWAAVMPLGESLTMRGIRAKGLDYGRLRLWGSASFIVASVGGGWVVAQYGPESPYWMALAALLATAAIATLLPANARQSSADKAAAQTPADKKVIAKGALRTLIADRAFLICLAAATLIQASHAVYYAFSTLHWRAAGHSETVIGLLWGEGVLAEIILFAFGAPLVRRIGPARLLMIAAVGGILRWTALGMSTDLPWLIMVQWLHAATFGATHLAVVEYVMSRVPERCSASAMALYSATAFGVGSGLAIAASGHLYRLLDGQAFWTMTVLAFGGLILALVLRKQRKGRLE